MLHIRVRLTIKLNRNQVVNLDDWKVPIQQAIAQSLPEGVDVDIVKVTRINEAKEASTIDAPTE